MKENLTIVRKQVSIVAQEQLNGNNIMYAYEQENDNAPQSVSFSVYRNQEGQPNHNQVAIQGNVTLHGGFNVNNNNFQMGDMALYEHIFQVSTEILTPETEVNDTESEQ